MHRSTSCPQQKRMHCSTSCLNRYTKSYLLWLCIKLIDKPLQKAPGRVSYTVLRVFISLYFNIEWRKDILRRKTLFCSGYLPRLLQNVLCIHFCFFFIDDRLWKKESINRNRKVSAIDNRLSAIIVPSLVNNRNPILVINRINRFPYLFWKIFEIKDIWLHKMFIFYNTLQSN